MIIKNSEKKEKSITALVVEVGAGEFQPAVNEVFRHYRNKFSVPGFRKGKAPLKIIEKTYGISFQREALEKDIVPKVLTCISEGSGLNIIGAPDVTNVDIKEDGGVDITVEVTVYPEVKLGEYKGLSAVKPAPEVLESEIDREIEGMRLRNVRVEKVNRPAVNGDTLVIDFEGSIDGEPFEGGKGENYEYLLGSSGFIPGFDEKIQGMTVGEERLADIVFPEDYAEHLAGKPAVFRVKLNEHQERILPELDDEFVKDVSEFDTLAEYRASIREKILLARQIEADTAFENALMNKLLDSIEVDLPEIMIEAHLDDVMENFNKRAAAYKVEPESYLKMLNMTPQTYRENMRPDSERQLKIMLTLLKISELEGIEISEEDLENEYSAMAKRLGLETDKLKEEVSKEALTDDMKFKRATKIIIDSAAQEQPDAEKAAEKTDAEDAGVEPPVSVETSSSAEGAEEISPEAEDAEDISSEAEDAGETSPEAEDAEDISSEAEDAGETSPEAEDAEETVR